MIFFWLTILAAFASYSNEEQEWLKRIKNGDKQAMKLLYRKYKNLLFGMIVSILKDREEAEDCLQEVFTQIWEKADYFDSEKGRAYSFIVTMARNKAIDRTRSKQFKQADIADNTINDSTIIPESDEKNPHEAMEFRERAAIVRSALQKIPEKERELLIVSYYKGLSQSQIAEKMDIPLGTVKYRMRQGMIKLRDYIVLDK